MQNFVKIGHTRYHKFLIFKMAVVHNLGYSSFLIFKFFIADWVRMTNMHCHTNFIKVGQMVAEILHLIIVKMMAVCHLGFSKI